MTTEADVRRLLALPAPGDWTIEELSRALAMPRRDIEAAIETLRLEGNPIIAGARGVRLTDNPAELAAYLEARRRRLVSQYKGTRALRRALNHLRGHDGQQRSLWDGAA